MLSDPHRAGALRHCVTIQRPNTVAARSATGADVTDFADVAKDRPALVEDIAGREAFSALQISAESTKRVTLRWAADLAEIAPRWRLCWTPPGLTAVRYLDVQAVINAENRNVWLSVLCREMV